MITQEISMDLVYKNVPPKVDAVQGEKGSRAVKLNLFAANQPWEIPAGASAAFRYRKPDKTGGTYSNLPDATPAWSISGNSLTMELAEQVLTVPGVVAADVVIIQSDSILATFPLLICVSPDPSADVPESKDYFEYETLSQINAAILAAEKASAKAAASAAAVKSEVAVERARIDNLISTEGEETQSDPALSIASGTWEPLLFGGAFPDGVTATGWYTKTGNLVKAVIQLEGSFYGLDNDTGVLPIGGFSSACGAPYSAPKSCTCTNFRVWTNISGTSGAVVDEIGQISYGSDYGWVVNVEPLQTEAAEGETYTAIIQFEYVAAAAAASPAIKELVDIRVAYDGGAHPTAGEAVREQISKAMESGGGSINAKTNSYIVEEDTGGITEVRVNLLDVSAATTGKFLTNTGSLGNNAEASYCNFIPVTGGEIYCFQFISTRTYIASNERICVYDSEQVFVEAKQPSISGYDATCYVTPDTDGYVRMSWPTNATEVMLSKGGTRADYVEYVSPEEDAGGDTEEPVVTEDYTTYHADKSLAEAVRNIGHPEYQLSDYMLVDKDGVTEWVEEHSHNGKYTCKITPNSTSGNTVTFQGFNLYPVNNYVGIWLYASRKDIGTTSGGNLSFTVYLNDVLADTFNNRNLVAGLQYLQIDASAVVTPISKLSITVGYSDTGNIPSLYVESIASGNLHDIPMIIWTNDCTAKTFHSNAYPLFKKYGIPANFDYYAGTEEGAGWSWSDETEALQHFDMLANNMGYGVYSYTGNYSGVSPGDYANGDWTDFAKYLWKACNDWGIFGPNMVQSANHNVGAAYNEAMIAAGFSVIRHSMGGPIAYFDPDTREFPCCGLDGGWDDPSTVLSTFKGYVSNAIARGADLMIINHAVLDADDGSGLNISAEAITLCLEYLQNLHKAGIVRAVSVEEFLASRAPELYASWQKHKQADEQKYLVTKMQMIMA